MEPAHRRGAIPVGLLVVLTGATFAVSDVYFASRSASLLPIDLRVAILLCSSLGTVVAGGWLLRSRPANRHVLRVLGWWAGGMLVTLLMATTLLQYQSQHGVRLVTPVAVLINSVTVGSTGGLLIAYFYTKARERAVSLAVEHVELQRERERLEILNRMLSHDIRNDMSVVLGWIDFLAESATAEQRQLVERIHTASEHVVELTDLATEYVSVVVDEDSMATKPVDLVETLRIELETCRDVYPDSEFVLRTDLESVYIEANELLNSVFRNVLNNAVQHNDSDAPQVDVTATQRGDTVRIEIADNGPGVPDSRKDTFFQKDELGFESVGTGLGLYLVNALVSEYGGSVWIEDNEPTGAIVVVELVRSPADRAPSTPNPGHLRERV